MTKGASMLDRALLHERAIVASCLLVVILLCWSYILGGAGTMQEMGDMLMPMSTWPWTIGHATLMLVMWMAMMAAMMLPSAAPMILLYSSIARRSSASGHALPVAPALFALGYLAVWSAFSMVAVSLQFLLEWAALLSPMMESASVSLSGALLIGAGVYQFTPLKRSCLQRCRSPFDFLTSHWRPGKRGAVLMGLRHGMICLGCCWGLMLLLFVGGVMNILWIAALAAFVLVEKLAPGGEWLGRAAGLALIAWGAVLIVAPLV